MWGGRSVLGLESNSAFSSSCCVLTRASSPFLFLPFLSYSILCTWKAYWLCVCQAAWKTLKQLKNWNVFPAWYVFIANIRRSAICAFYFWFYFIFFLFWKRGFETVFTKTTTGSLITKYILYPVLEELIPCTLFFHLNTDKFEGHLHNLFGHDEMMLWMSLGADWGKLLETLRNHRI